MKALEIEPYTVEDSERAAGFGSFKIPQKRQIDTQLPKNDIDFGPVSKKVKTV